MVRSAWILRQVKRLVRYIYAGCDRILVQSRAFAEPIQRLGVDAQKIEYFPNSAEELYQPVSPSPGTVECATLPAGFRVMFAGNIGAAQDFETILAAAEKVKSHPDIHWVVLGDGHGRWVKRGQSAASTGCSFARHHPIETMPQFLLDA
jgi:glycosyltransferase involved in cell wall biosynthesis